MRIAFMGTPDFAVPILVALAQSHEVVAVYARPDAASGRGRRMRPSPVKVAALERGLEVRQPATLKDAQVQADFADLSLDVCVVAAYGLLLPEAVLKAPKYGCINVHASLLPRWRGAAPIQRAILAGDDVTGISIMSMELGLDTGPVCMTESTPVDDKDAPSLTSELSVMGADAIIRTINELEGDSLTWVAQDDSLATYADKVAKSDVLLSPDLSAQTASRRIRASGPAAPARLIIGSVGLTVVSAQPVADLHVSEGEFLIDRDTVLLGFRDGALTLRVVKPDGRGVMDASAWARGLRQDTGTWGSVL